MENKKKKKRIRINRIWSNIKDRCSNENHKYYINYGGRGIKNKWKSFKEFKNDMYDSYYKHIKDYGEKNTTLERIDNDSDYCKENCRWATWIEQNNNRRNNHYIKYNNEIKTMTEWSRCLNIKYSRLSDRINKFKYSGEEAINYLVSNRKDN